MTAPKLTEAQKRVLSTRAGYFVHGADTRTAKRLEAMGLCTVEDNGYLRSDNERWLMSITEAGRFALYVELHCNNIPQCCASHGSCRCLCDRCLSSGRFPLQGGS